MTEAEARQWLGSRFDARRIARLDAYVALLLYEARRQSLIARSTFATVWARHIVDSAQLLECGDATGTWLDVGSGGGLPGVVLAILGDQPVILCEPRRKRSDFLTDCVAKLGLRNTTVAACAVQRLTASPDIITARAVSSTGALLTSIKHLVSRETQLILPRGQSADDDAAQMASDWNGVFHVKRSVTDQAAGIVIASGLSRK